MVAWKLFIECLLWNVVSDSQGEHNKWRLIIRFLCDLKASHVGIAWFGKQIPKLTFLWPWLYVQGKVAAHLPVGRWCAKVLKEMRGCCPRLSASNLPDPGASRERAWGGLVRWPGCAVWPASAFSEWGLADMHRHNPLWDFFSVYMIVFYEFFVELFV